MIQIAFRGTHRASLVSVQIRNPTLRRPVIQVQSLAGRTPPAPIKLFVEH